MIAASALDSHSTTFIQSKDVDPASTSENSQCRCSPLSPPLLLPLPAATRARQRSSRVHTRHGRWSIAATVTRVLVFSICLVPFTKGDEVRLLPCMHMHHKDCIDPWLLQKNQCPVCRSPPPLPHPPLTLLVLLIAPSTSALLPTPSTQEPFGSSCSCITCI